MGKWITLLNDLCVLVFDLMLYTQMTTLREDKVRNRRILYAGCAVIVGFYILAVFVLLWPASISAFVCMTLPSLALFWLLSKYRDARFFLTFCFVDTVSLIIGYMARYAGILFGNIGGMLVLAVMLLSFILIYRAGKPYFQRYREALEFIDHGWKWLACSAALIYITMIFCAVYPAPLIRRPEYFLPYFVISVMVLSFYTVFLINITITRKVYEQSIRLKEQQKWFRAAYIDALTEIPNRAANCLSDCFSEENSTVYRIGGDEFAVIVVGAKEDMLLRKLKALEEAQSSDRSYSISAGYAFVDRSEKNAVNQAFSRADAMMYAHKTQKNCR